MRIDQFLWCVRQFKSRNLATSGCKKGDIKINNKSVKPSKEVMISDMLQIRKNQVWHKYKIIGFPISRMGPKFLNLYLEETTERFILEEENLKKLSFKIQRSPGKGRPTKKERRKIDNFDKKN